MTDQPDLTPDQPVTPSGQAGGPTPEGSTTAPGAGASAPEGAASTREGSTTAPEAGGSAPAGEPVVVRDNRRSRSAGGAEQPAPPAAPAAPAAGAEGAAAAPGDAAAAEGPEEPTGAGPAEAPEAAGGLGAELAALRTDLEERTRDLQRVTAEYANYRKRVERDRERLGEQAVAGVLSALLPVLDDLDRAKEHEELPDGVTAVADHLVATLAKFGLSAFGEKGDPFDPNRHEAVAHQTSPDVPEPTCIDVMRRGYLLGDRLLRPAMVAVADPE